MSGLSAVGHINHVANVLEAAGMGTVTIADLRATAVAVAELIEAARGQLPFLLHPSRRTNSQWMTDQDRRRAEANEAFRAALARVAPLEGEQP